MMHTDYPLTNSTRPIVHAWRVRVNISATRCEGDYSDDGSVGAPWGARVKSARKLFGGSSQPTGALEQEVECYRHHQHQRQRERVAEQPVQLRHVVEVHPIDGANQRRGEQDRRPGADLLHLVVLPDTRLREGLDLLVLLQPHEREVDAQDVLEEILVASDPLVDLYGVVLDVP